MIDILDIVSKNVTVDEDLPDIRQVVYGTELAETFTPDQPIPYIRDLTTTGLLLIEWDRLMTLPDDPQSINKAKVAVSNQNTTDPFYLTRRMMYSRWYGLYDNFELDPEWYLIIEALELKVLPGDPDTELSNLNFTWDLVSYDKRQIYI